MPKDDGYEGWCPLGWALEVTGGKWKGLILWHLGAAGVLRHAELRRRLRGITQKVLTQQLRALEDDGLVRRTARPGFPRRVEYRLTDLGAAARPHLEGLRVWASSNPDAGRRLARRGREHWFASRTSP